jgi:hypothetical protein
VQASIGWQAQSNGSYYTSGPYQYRENPSCFIQNRATLAEHGTNCNFQFNSSALMAKHCHAEQTCTKDAPWGFRDFYQPNVVSILFPGNWHLAGSYELDGSLQSCTSDATARFLVPNHVTRIYFAGSFWWTIWYPASGGTISSDSCTGMTAIS